MGKSYLGESQKGLPDQQIKLFQSQIGRNIGRLNVQSPQEERGQNFLKVKFSSIEKGHFQD
jgi:hypothetical protein